LIKKRNEWSKKKGKKEPFLGDGEVGEWIEPGH